MSHGWTWTPPDGEEGGEVNFIFNGDYSGDVRINQHINDDATTPEEHCEEIEVPFAALKAFVLNYLREEKIGKLEMASYDELEEMLFK